MADVNLSEFQPNCMLTALDLIQKDAMLVGMQYFECAYLYYILNVHIVDPIVHFLQSPISNLQFCTKTCQSK